MNLNKIVYKIGKAEYLDIVSHLKKCDNSFSPRLSSYVNIEEYSKKVLNNAVTFEAWEEKTLVGLVACYLNNQKSKKGFITNVSVLEAYVANGIGKQLLSNCEKYSIKLGIKVLDLEVSVNNNRALSLYSKQGFVFAGKEDEKYKMKKYLDEIEPLVSICCLTYNHARYIRKAIESFMMQQTNFPFEVLIHDDASTDNTQDIVREYEEKYPGVIKPIYQKENQYSKGVRVSATFNFPRTKGKYIAMCEGDDYWTDPNKLQQQVDFLETNQQYPMCFTNSVIIDADGNVTKANRVPEDKKHNLSQREILSGYCPPTNTALIRAEFVNEYIENSAGIMNGDFLLYNIVTKYGNAAYLDINSAAYRMHNNGVWSNKDDGYRTINYIKVNRRLENLVRAENQDIVDEAIRNAYISLYNSITEETFTDGSFWTPQTAMLRSIRDTIIQVDGVAATALSIDNNPTVEKIVTHKWPEIEITKASYPEYDAQNLHQFKSESFDIVFSHQVLEHIPKPWLAAKEMNRVLKAGGIGIHSSCAYNPRHGYPAFKDYYRFLPDGLAELFDDVEIWVKEGWGSKQALIYNLAIDDGNGQLGGRRFVEAMAKQNDIDYPWHTWLIFLKK